jgi:glutaredoxin
VEEAEHASFQRADHDEEQEQRLEPLEVVHQALLGLVINVTNTPKEVEGYGVLQGVLSRQSSVVSRQFSGEYPRDMRVMYVKPRCPYCQAARDSLAADGLEWEERDATTQPNWRAELMEFSKGTGMVPTIVNSGQVETVGWKGRG